MLAGPCDPAPRRLLRDSGHGNVSAPQPSRPCLSFCPGTLGTTNLTAPRTFLGTEPGEPLQLPAAPLWQAQTRANRSSVTSPIFGPCATLLRQRSPGLWNTK